LVHPVSKAKPKPSKCQQFDNNVLPRNNLAMPANRKFTEQQIRDDLSKRMKTMTQADVSRITGIFPPNISQMVRGAPLTARMMKWLGYREIRGIYEKLEETK
jgi:hypothetical protein